MAEIERASEKIPVLHAPNFFVSVNVLGHLAREAARLLGDGYDTEIFELHHGQKRDAPSGTALFLGEAVAEGQSLVAGQAKSLRDHAVPHRRKPTGAIRDPIPRPDHVIHPFLARSGCIDEALHDLDTVEIGVQRILDRLNQESRCIGIPSAKEFLET